MIFDALENWRCYGSRPAWERAFAWIEGLAPDIAPGEYPIDGRDIYAAVFDYSTKNLLDTTLEAHRTYVDVHVALPAPTGGPEVQGRFGLDELEELSPYEADTDAARYHHPDRFRALFTLHPGQFCAYFPQDAHLSQGKTGAAPEALRKVVVKIRADLLKP
jgi:YhcH/YjgK/YiaL family protein